MNISWVLADHAVLDPTLDIVRLKNIGPLWGSWRTWRAYQTDNVVCHEFKEAVPLLQRQFQKLCNLYLPNTLYQQLDRPEGVKLYDGDFNMDVQNRDELVSMHLASSLSDIVLLVGFDWQPKDKNPDRLIEHVMANYRNLVKHLISDDQKVQWVLVDHTDELMDEVKNLPNLTQDTMQGVFNLIGD